jgi:hypothetical protein
VKASGLLEAIDDRLNPIVVKELRQAVHSRFVTAVLLLFLLFQLLYLGIHLVVAGFEQRAELVEFQIGSDVFMVLQGILLGMCMLFLPAYTGIRLAAERLDVNIDLMYISTLKTRSIIAGKFFAALILALIIFSACAPFMAFTYFLRGIDWPSILVVIAFDFLVVMASTQLAIFLAVIPGNRVFKAIIGLIGFGMLLWIFAGAMGGSIGMILSGIGSLLDDADFQSASIMVVLGIVGAIGLMYTWSVALISPPSSNRAVTMRLYLLGFWLVSLGVSWVASRMIRFPEGPFLFWIISMSVLSALCVIIAVNERERWAPRVARTIPRNWLLRVLAFLVYSGAAGGVMFAGVLFGLTALGVMLWRQWVLPEFPRERWHWHPDQTKDFVQMMFEMVAIGMLYVYCYALTAVFLRDTLLRRAVSPVFTWILIIFLLFFGCLAPFLISFMIAYPHWRIEAHFYSLLLNPGAAMAEFADFRSPRQGIYVMVAAVWAGLVTALNAPWFVKQIARFQPYRGSTLGAPPAPMPITAGPLDETKTAV